MFSANSGSGLNHYRNVGVDTLATTAAPHQLVLMLFDGARAAIAQAKGYAERREIAAKGKSISQAISIIDGGLKASLDLRVGGELAQNLSDLYVYMGQRLLHANLKNDAAALDEVAMLLGQLGEAWRSIAARPAAAARAGIAPAPSAPTNHPALSGPARAYVTAAALAPAQSYGAAVASAAPPGRVASTPPASNADAVPSTSPTPASPSPQSRRLAAAYGSP